MTRGLSEINWDEVTDVAPVVVTAVTMPLTFFIANGIGFGFITYAVVKVLSGRMGEVSPAAMVIAALFAAKFTIV